LLIPHVAACKLDNIRAKVAFALHFSHLALLGDTLRVRGATGGLSQTDQFNLESLDAFGELISMN
jgi:hypothetical protein